MPVIECDARSLSGLGLRDEDVSFLCRTVRRGRGATFVCGPPGSGRRTAMYGLLCSVNHEAHSLAAVHRAIQKRMVRVMQTRLTRGKDVADWLHAAMRMDTDVLMVEPLERIADAVSLVRAASRMVVIVGAVAESSLTPLLDLVDMGAPAGLICQMVSCVMSCRVAPRLCPHCRREMEVPQELLSVFPPLQQAALHLRAYESTGCEHCLGTGRRGRLALYEVREVGLQLEGILAGRYTRPALVDAGLRATVMALAGDALRKSDAGLLDLRDLGPLLAKCPTTAPVVRFWES